MDELCPGKPVIDGPAQPLIWEYLCKDEVDIRLIGGAQGLEKMAGGLVQVAPRR